MRNRGANCTIWPMTWPMVRLPQLYDYEYHCFIIWYGTMSPDEHQEPCHSITMPANAPRSRRCWQSVTLSAPHDFVLTCTQHRTRYSVTLALNSTRKFPLRFIIKCLKFQGGGIICYEARAPETMLKVRHGIKIKRQSPWLFSSVGNGAYRQPSDAFVRRTRPAT
jgi:hypothetical protein